MDSNAALSLAVAVGLGLLVGIQREWAGPHLAGVRTFTLLTLLGAQVGLLAEDLGGWPIAAALAAVAAVFVAGYAIRTQEPEQGSGLTTSVAALSMTAAGVAAGVGRIELAVLTGGAVAVLLQWKRPLHRMVERIGETDIRAAMRLALIGLVVLPILPDRSFGPYGVLNPFEIWLVVVLICGISLAGYLLHRFVGRRTGALLGGLIGGLVSSTATTISHARRSRTTEGAEREAALIIVVASTIAFGRVLAEVAVIAPGILSGVAPQLVVMASVLGAIALAMAVRQGAGRERPEVPDDPLELKAALLFGLAFVVILLTIAVLRERVGDDALYGVAVISGLTDVDAITLSTARLVEEGDLSLDTGWRMILLGSMSNLVFKAGAVAVLGGRRAAALVGLAFGASIVTGGLVLAFWP
ncbi:MAG: MgtC/SapB family protein [Planctomycetota bacterium JB042]